MHLWRFQCWQRNYGLQEKSGKTTEYNKFSFIMIWVSVRINEKWHVVMILQWQADILSMSRWLFRDYCLNSEMKGWADLDKLMTVYYQVSSNVTWLVRNKCKSVNTELQKWHVNLSLEWYNFFQNQSMKQFLPRLHNKIYSQILILGNWGQPLIFLIKYF